MKLKKVKAGLKLLNSHHGNLHYKVSKARSALLNYQSDLHINPSTEQLLGEKNLASTYLDALQTEEIFLKQKFCIQWLKHGDGNNKFFFNACKAR